MTGPTIYTIGHSNHSIEGFLGLLSEHGVKRLIDVRSAPYSRYSPHFSRKSLEAYLRDVRIAYHYEGVALGGRPDDPGCYDAAGQVDYQRIERQNWYRDGIERLLVLAGETPSAIMCSEENPESCHRHNLITRTLLSESRAIVMHIRGDGRTEPARIAPVQTRLF
jgi:uncharacterized protein (DUF488 family)